MWNVGIMKVDLRIRDLSLQWKVEFPKSFCKTNLLKSLWASIRILKMYVINSSTHLLNILSALDLCSSTLELFFQKLFHLSISYYDDNQFCYNSINVVWPWKKSYQVKHGAAIKCFNKIGRREEVVWSAKDNSSYRKSWNFWRNQVPASSIWNTD